MGSLCRLMDMLQQSKERERKLRFQDFFVFDDYSNLIGPHNICSDLEKYQAPIGIKVHMITVYSHIVNLQSNEAEIHYLKFASLVQNADTLSKNQLEYQANKEAGIFMAKCTAVVENLKKSAKALNKGRTAQAIRNKKVNADIKKIQIPNPVVYLPKYFNDPEVQELDERLIRKATTDESVSANDVKDLTNHVITATSLKNGVRQQVITQLLNSEFLEALNGRQMLFPYIPKNSEELDNDEEDDDEGEELAKCFKFDPNRQEDVPEQEASYMKGILVEKVYHKTALQGPAKLWLSKVDITRFECYRACITKYANGKNKTYDTANGPLFVNSDLTPWSRDGKRQPNYTIWSRVCNIPQFRSHWTRSMFSSFAANQKNILVRELAAMAASHSVSTQQQTYRTDALQAIQAVSINDYYRKQCKLIEEQMNKDSALPYISDEYSKNLRIDLEEFQRSKEDKFLRQEEAKEKGEVVRESRTLTNNVKYAIMKLVISAEDKFLHGKFNWNVNFPKDFMTGKQIRNMKNKRNFLMNASICQRARARATGRFG